MASARDKRDAWTSLKANEESCDNSEHHWSIQAKNGWSPICLSTEGSRFNSIEWPGLQPLVPSCSPRHMEWAAVLPSSVLTRIGCSNKVVTTVFSFFGWALICFFLGKCKLIHWLWKDSNWSDIQMSIVIVNVSWFIDCKKRAIGVFRDCFKCVFRDNLFYNEDTVVRQLDW